MKPDDHINPSTRQSAHRAARKTAWVMGLIALGFYLGIMALGIFGR